LEKGFNLCYSKKTDSDFPKVTALEKYLNIKGYAKAVVDKKVVSLHWNNDEGYMVTPTTKIPKKGYVKQKENAINLGRKLKSYELAEALQTAMNLSKI